MRVFSCNVADRTAYDAVHARLDEAGIELVTRWEAIPHSGPLIFAPHTLSRRRGPVSWEVLIAGQDARELQSLRGFILHHPLCADWKLQVRNAPMRVEPGHFALVESTCFEGGSTERLQEIVAAFGGDSEDLDFALHSEEKVLGYFPQADQAYAEALAEVVQIGATTPVSREELVQTLAGFRDAALARQRGGDSEAVRLAGIWQRVADRWRQESKPVGSTGSGSRQWNLTRVLRWLGVLPGAVLAGFVLQFPLHWALMGALNWVEPYPAMPERLLGPFCSGLAFVVAGTHIAPSHRWRTAAVLFGICVAGIAAGVILTVVRPDFGSVHLYFRYGGAPLVMALLGAVVGLFLSRPARQAEPA